MCGIVGIVAADSAHLSSGDLDLFEELLKANAARGEDSTGAFAVDCAGTVRWIKVAAHPFALIHTPEWKDFRAWCSAHAEQLWGHNRKATVGEIKNDNAHPFVHNHITLIHNGYVQNPKDFPDADVDSEGLAKALGGGMTPETLAQTLKGAFTLVWADTKAKKVYIMRNSDRPLFMGKQKDRYMFASEGPMLHWILHRNTETAEYKQLTVETLYSIDCEKRVLTETETPFHRVSPRAGRNGSGQTYEVLDRPTLPTKSTASKSLDQLPNINELIPFKLQNSALSQMVSNTILVWGVTPDGLAVESSIHASEPGPVMAKLHAATTLEGRVRAIYLMGGKASLKVTDVGISQVMRIMNDKELPVREWHAILKNEKCTVCKGGISHSMHKYTSVKKKGNNKYRIICANCTCENFQRLSEAKQANIVALNGYSPLDWEVEKALGSTIQ